MAKRFFRPRGGKDDDSSKSSDELRDIGGPSNQPSIDPSSSSLPGPSDPRRQPGADSRQQAYTGQQKYYYNNPAPPHTRSIRSALTSSTGGTSLFSRDTNLTGATSMASSAGSGSAFGKRHQPDAERIQILDARAIAESHEDAAQSLVGSAPIAIPRLGRQMDVVSDAPVVHNIPMNVAPEPLSPRQLSLPRAGMLAPLPEAVAISPDSSTHMHIPPSMAASVPSFFGETLEVETLPDDGSPNAEEETRDLTTTSQMLNRLRTKLLPLYQRANAQNVSRLAGLMAQRLKDYSELVRVGPCDDCTTGNNYDLVKIIQMVLYLADNLLNKSSVRSAKMNLLRSLYNFGTKLGLVDETTGPVVLPRNWALGSEDVLYADLAEDLIDGISQGMTLNLEDEGSYIAPVLRGFSPKMSVVTLCFGFPRFSEHDCESLMNVQDLCPDLHIYGRKDYIRAASRVAPPFRVPENPSEPPISLSLASQNAQHTSGTLGGYVYPIIDDRNAQLADYKNSTFAVTCGHVVLCDKTSEKHPSVMVPSPVLRKLFEKALQEECVKHRPNSMEWQAYKQALVELEESEPGMLGHVTWGERVVVEGMLSDLALIKVLPDLKCRNFLGEDINMSQYDPGLLMSNLTINHVIPKPVPGLNVFKYGSTTKYTTGISSKSRIVYWSNKKLQSSEFVVKSDSPVFASGGDSGAWILTRNERGLGVLGMIHSYDGEFKEFGLFTPINRILSRLQQITGVQWGIVGVPNDGDHLAPESD